MVARQHVRFAQRAQTTAAFQLLFHLVYYLRATARLSIARSHRVENYKSIDDFIKSSLFLLNFPLK